MLRKPKTIAAIVALLVIALGAIMLTAGTEQAQAQKARPALPVHGTLTESQEIRWCHFRWRDDYQAKAACTTRVVWTGNWRRGKEAVRVGWCESGLNHTRGVPGATYWGAWQFDANARRTYRWGYSLVEQVGATVRMNKARGWQPWPECKPGGVRHAERWANAPRSVQLYG